MSALSNWREGFNLSEVVTGKMTDKEALKKVSEKSGINNKVTINPKLDEAVKEIGGEVVAMVEADTTAQHRRLDMKQMILDRQKLKIRRKDMAQKKKEGDDAEPTNATQQSNVITAEAVQGQDTATRKAMAGERKSGYKRVAPGKAKQNAERVMQSVRFYDKITKGKHTPGVAEEVVVDVKKENEKKRKNALQIQKVIGEGDVHSGQGEKIQSRTKKWMDKKGQKGAPGLDAIRARAAEHKAKRGVKEETEVKEGILSKFSKKKKVEKKPSMDTITTKVHKWRKDREKEERRKYVSDFDPIDEGKGYQPEIEHSKLGDAKKKADKKRESKLPPHLQGDAIGKMKKAFATEEDKAFNFVLDKIRKEVGKDGYVSKDNPRKPQSDADKAKARAHQAKVDKENAAERAKDPSQGRYPKG